MTWVGPSRPLEHFQAEDLPLENLKSETLKTLVKVSLHIFSRVEEQKLTYVSFSNEVTSQWHYSRDSEVKVQDKDFKRLNKSALGNRATTAHVSAAKTCILSLSANLSCYLHVATILLPPAIRFENQTSNST